MTTTVYVVAMCVRQSFSMYCKLYNILVIIINNMPLLNIICPGLKNKKKTFMVDLKNFCM